MNQAENKIPIHQKITNLRPKKRNLVENYHKSLTFRQNQKQVINDKRPITTDYNRYIYIFCICIINININVMKKLRLFRKYIYIYIYGGVRVHENWEYQDT